MARRRGNPNWGRPRGAVVPQVQSTYEKALVDFGLDGADEHVIARSHSFQAWARKNQRKHYIPESLLTAMGIEVELEIE